jgi:uncharacterized coiled-coil protein SlyX
MSDSERISLEARIEALEQRLALHESMRSGAIDALGLVQASIDRLQRRMVSLPPEVEAARQSGWLETAAIIKTRQRATDEWLQELARIVVTHHDLITEIVGMLKRGGE